MTFIPLRKAHGSVLKNQSLNAETTAFVGFWLDRYWVARALFSSTLVALQYQSHWMLAIAYAGFCAPTCSISFQWFRLMAATSLQIISPKIWITRNSIVGRVVSLALRIPC